MFLIKLLEFIFSTVAIFFSWVLVMSIISSVINPQIIIEENKAIEKNNNARLIYALIIAICWALVIVIP
jgi:hypothetical protein